MISKPSQVSDKAPSDHTTIVQGYAETAIGSIVRMKKPTWAVVARGDGDDVTYQRVAPSHGYHLTGTVQDVFMNGRDTCYIVRLDRESRNFLVAQRPDLVAGLTEMERERSFDNWGSPKVNDASQFGNFVDRRGVRFINAREAARLAFYPQESTPVARLFKAVAALKNPYGPFVQFGVARATKHRRPPRSRLYNPLSIKKLGPKKP